MTSTAPSRRGAGSVASRREAQTPAIAWRMIGLAMLIGIAKKMPWLPSSKAVDTPTTDH